MIHRIELTMPVRIQLRWNDQHDVDADWWRRENESEAEQQERRQAWREEPEYPYGRVLHSLTVDHDDSMIRHTEKGAAITHFYIRSISDQGDTFEVTYGSKLHPLNEKFLRVSLKRALVRKVIEETK